jgi:tetratricopeptide (TPR) repeat protein
VYFDYDGMVFLKDIPQHAELISRYKVDLTSWEPDQPLDVYRIGAVRVTPYQQYYRAYTLAALGLNDPAFKQAEIALKVDPAYGEVHQLLGKMHADKQNWDTAFTHSRAAVLYKGEDLKARYNMVNIYMETERYKLALEHLFKILDRFPDQTRAYFLLAKNYILLEKFDEAEEAMSMAESLAPNAIGDLFKLGQLFVDKEAHDRALEVFNKVKQSSPEFPGLYYEMGRIYKSRGDLIKAEELYRKALVADPGNEDLKKSLHELLSQI